MDPRAKQATPPQEVVVAAEDSTSAKSEHWSPFSTSRARWAWGLMTVFTVIYFAVAVLTSAEFADLAATEIAGLPLGFILGIGLIISGLVITRVYLVKVES